MLPTTAITGRTLSELGAALGASLQLELDEGAMSLGQWAKRLLAGCGRERLVKIPRTRALARLLHLEQIGVEDRPSVLADRAGGLPQVLGCPRHEVFWRPAFDPGERVAWILRSV